MEYIAAIITAIGTIIIAWFKYDQTRKDAMTKLEIEQTKLEMEARAKRRADNSAIVHGELWKVLHFLQADRVYIVQPHPLGNESMVSVYFESTGNQIKGMKEHIQQLKMSEVAIFCAEMAKNLYIFYDDIDTQVKDDYAKSILMAYGTKKVAIKRLNDSKHDWVGSIFCEFTHDMKIDEEVVRSALHECAVSIQYILPEYK